MEKAGKIEQQGENSSVQLRESLEIHPDLKSGKEQVEKWMGILVIELR